MKLTTLITLLLLYLACIPHFGQMDSSSSVTFTLPLGIFQLIKYLVSIVYVVCIGLTILCCAVIAWERRKTKKLIDFSSPYSCVCEAGCRARK